MTFFSVSPDLGCVGFSSRCYVIISRLQAFANRDVVLDTFSLFCARLEPVLRLSIDDWISFTLRRVLLFSEYSFRTQGSGGCRVLSFCGGLYNLSIVRRYVKLVVYSHLGLILRL